MFLRRLVNEQVFAPKAIILESLLFIDVTIKLVEMVVNILAFLYAKQLTRL